MEITGPGLKKGLVDFKRDISAYYLATQSFFEGKQSVTGKTKLQYFTAQLKRENNHQLNSYSNDPDPLSFANFARAWGVKSDFPREDIPKISRPK